MKKKIISITICLCLCLITYFPCCAYATDLNDIYGGGGDALWGQGTLKTKVGDILGIIQVIGYVTAIVITAVIGIKFIVASPEGKATIKQHILGPLIGVLLLVAGSTLIAIFSALGRSI